MKPRNWKLQINWIGLATSALLLVIWEILVDTKIINYAYLPAPTAILHSASGMISSGILLSSLAHTVVATLIGWLIAAVVGVGLGVLLGLSRFAWVYSMSSVDALRSLPVVAFVPVAVIIFGFTTQSEVVVAAYAALWPILLNTLAGIQDTKIRLIEVGRCLQLTRLAQVWKLRLPAAAMHIITGLRLGLAVSLVLVLVAEMIGNPNGIGHELITDSNSLQPEKMFVSIFAVGLTGMILNAAIMLGARVLAGNQMAAAGEGQ